LNAYTAVTFIESITLSIPFAISEEPLQECNTLLAIYLQANNIYQQQPAGGVKLLGLLVVLVIL
jgi:hypothetical protein